MLPVPKEEEIESKPNVSVGCVHAREAIHRFTNLHLSRPSTATRVRRVRQHNPCLAAAVNRKALATAADCGTVMTLFAQRVGGLFYYNK